MRDGTIYNVLDQHTKRIDEAVGTNFRMFGQAILDIATYRETWETILFNRGRLIWFAILMVFRPKKAVEYFKRLSSELTFSRLSKQKQELQAQVDAEIARKNKEGKCSDSGKKDGAQTGGSPKEIVTPSKNILDANGRPMQSK